MVGQTEESTMTDEATQEQSNEDQPKRKPVIKKKDNRFLRCKLTDEEKMRYAEEMADAQQTVVDLKSDEASFKTTLKGKMTKAEGTISSRAELVRTGFEHRDVKVEEILDYETERFKATRLDTEEVIEERPMNRRELEQLPLEVPPETPEPEPNPEDESTGEDTPEPKDTEENEDEE